MAGPLNDAGKHIEMGTWIKDTMTTGAVVATTTTAVAALLGRLESGSAAAPINAVSHILVGDDEDTGEQVDVKHTLAGAGLNAMAVTGWAAVHELFMPRTGRPTVQRALVSGTATAALAYITDYHVMPKRLTPGFEKRLSGAALFSVFATLAVFLAAASLYRGRQE
jgi:hypothetical protein